MQDASTLFIGMFTTLLAIINPLEVLPIFLKLLQGKDDETHRNVARRACLYAMALAFFFLVFGKLIMWAFGVPLSMVRIVGGIILMRIGFELFAPAPATSSAATIMGGSGDNDDEIAFVPLAMPIMFGPGAIATILGMTTMIKQSDTQILSLIALCLAIVTTMFLTYLSLAYAKKILQRIGPRGIDAATRIVGFFVATMGMGLIFHGVIEAAQTYGIIAAK